MEIGDYSDAELIQSMNLSDPSDRELEARIIFLIKKYRDGENAEMANFFDKAYDRFFGDISEDDEDELVEGFEQIEEEDTIDDDGNVVEDPDIKDYSLNPSDIKIEKKEGVIIKGETKNIDVIKQVELVDGKVNPLLLQTIKRVVSIDSQYRKDKTTLSTEFTFSLSDPLKDVVSLKLYSIGIPYTWYTVNKNFGSNFFLIQGNSPGINDATLNDFVDFKVEIKPGNYKPAQLVDTINASMNTELSTVTDMSFGNLVEQTYLEYNPYQSNTTLNIFFDKKYNESSYELEFPTWSTPNDPTLPGPRVETVPGFLGFNNKKYYFNQIQSLRNITSTDPIDALYTLTGTNNSFTIKKYIGPEPYTTASVIDETIIVNLGLTNGQYTRNAIQTALNVSLESNVQLTDSAMTTIHISDSSLNNYDNSYCNLTINFDRHETNNVLYSKPYIIFPDETGLVNDSRIWTGTSSCFRFEEENYDMVDVISETETLDLQTDTPILLNDLSFAIQCVKSGFDVSVNGYEAGISNSGTEGYTLNQFLSAFNNALTEMKEQSKNDPNLPNGTLVTGEIDEDNSKFVLNSDATFSIQLDMQKQFNKKDYKTELYKPTDISSNLTTILDFVDLSLNNHDSSLNSSGILYDATGINFSDTSFVLMVRPTEPSNGGNANSPSYEINLDDFLGADDMSVNFTYKNALPPLDGSMVDASFHKMEDVIFGKDSNKIEYYQKLPAFFNYLFENYQDADGDNVLSGTKLTVTDSDDQGLTYNLEMDVNKTLTEDAYQIQFYDSSYGIYQSGVTPSNGLSYLNFDPSFVLSPNNDPLLAYDSSVNVADFEQFTINANTTIRKIALSTSSIQIKKIVIDNTNNIFNINTFQHIMSPGNENNMSFTIQNGYYNRDELLVEINAALLSNTLLNSSSISTITKTINGEEKIYTIFRINIRKEYTAQDLKITFYDRDAFVSCYAGVSSVRNATSDTTLGWLLGFRKRTFYEMNDSTIINYSVNATTNQISIDGDTTVIVDLYNKLFIVIDDYNQNRLNDGLITNVDDTNSIPLPSYATRNSVICDPVTNSEIFALDEYDTTAKQRLTQNQMQSVAALRNDQTQTNTQSGAGPYAKDIFAVIPIKVSSLTNGQTYTEFGGTLQSQERLYFGPVNISRMTVKLISDRGDVVDLNGSDWTFSLIAEQLYQSSTK
jgi:hypothetical protein